MDWLEVGRVEELARMDTPVHRLDARAKVLVTLTFIAVVMSFPPKAISPLTPFLLFPAVLMAAGRIPARHIVKKILVAAPFALVVGMFNPFIDREPAAAFGPLVLSGGWLSFLSIMFRFVLTVGAALVMVACTGMFRLGAGLDRLGVPRVFVLQLLFLHRYLFVISDEAARMHRALQLRSATPRPIGLQVFGSLLGCLLLRSMDRAGRVYRAMIARGFDGNIRLLHHSTFGCADLAFVLSWLAFFAAARVWNLAEALGRLMGGLAA